VIRSQIPAPNIFELPASAAGGHQEGSGQSILLAAADLTNVVPFAKRRGDGTANEAPAIRVTGASRPALDLSQPERGLWMPTLFAVSLLVHGGVYGLLDQSPPPLASVGVEAVSVELVLGDDRPTAVAEELGKSPTPPAPEPELKPEAKLAPVLPADDEPTSSTSAESRQPEATPSPPTPNAAVPPPDPTKIEPVAPTPTARLPEPALLTNPPEQATRSKAQPSRELKRNQRVERTHQAALPQGAPERSANGVGRGRSDADTNYRGLVAAHLARYKQFPAEAKGRGEQGVATVSFRLDSGGRVSSVALVHGSGTASLDREVEAMVHRASPFPAPPSRQSMTFTVPVSFKLH
jgi:periplasmic protein TonB